MHGGSMAGHTMHPQQFHFYRQRRAPQQTGQLQLRFQLCGHQIQHQHLQRPPLLFGGQQQSFFFQLFFGRQPLRNGKRKALRSLPKTDTFFDRLLFRECLPGPGHSKADTYTHMRIHSSWLSCTESPSAFSFRFDQMKPTFQVGKSICPFPCVVNGAGRYEDRFTFPFAPLAGMFFL